MKRYEKPKLIKESLSCSSCLCACVARANSTETMQCGYPLSGTAINLFLDGWAGCNAGEAIASIYSYCYQSGATNVFGS